MDRFFRRHFRQKACKGGVRQRSSVAVPTGKVRRRSSAGLPSAGLAQRRRSSIQLQSALQKSNAIHAQLLGPSLLLTGVIQMSEKQESETRVSSASGYHSDSSWEDREESVEEWGTQALWLTQGLSTGKGIQPRPLLRAPRCLRRNSTHLLPADAVHHGPGYYGLYGRYRRNSQPLNITNLTRDKRRSSGAAWAYRRNSHWNQGTFYDPETDTWSGFISYVNGLSTISCKRKINIIFAIDSILPYLKNDILQLGTHLLNTLFLICSHLRWLPVKHFSLFSFLV